MNYLPVTLLAVVLLCLGNFPSRAQGTAFNYSGELSVKDAPARGEFDFQFRLWDEARGGTQIGPTIRFDALRVERRRFSVTLDFGLDSFDGDARWLEIGVRRSKKDEPYTVLKPRQNIRPVPYSIHATSASTLTGPIDIRQIPDATERSRGLVQIGTGLSVTGGVVSVTYGTNGDTAVEGNDSRLANGWNLNGNTGTSSSTNYLGTRDNQPLEFRVNDARALRLEPNATAPNIIAGSSANVIAPSVIGASISGGHSNVIGVGAHYAVIPGGFGAAARHHGQQAFASGFFSTPGDAQAGLYVLRGMTTAQPDPQIKELFLDGISERIRVPKNSVWMIDVSVAATSSVGDPDFGFIRNAMAWYQGSNLRVDWGETAGRAGISGSNGVLVVTVSGGGAARRWVAVVRTTEVKFLP